MSLTQQLQDDLKVSMIARDSFRTEVIKGLKSAILYAEVAANKRETGLDEQEVLAVLKKESKKRQESADLYVKGGNTEMADKELREKAIVDAYLPTQLDEAALSAMIDNAIKHLGIETPTKQDMGKIIGAVKVKGGANVDGAILARLVGSRISS